MEQSHRGDYKTGSAIDCLRLVSIDRCRNRYCSSPDRWSSSAAMMMAS